MKKLRKVRLLILDEWLLYPLKENEARDVLELIESRAKTASTIFCSQFDLPGWHENLYDPTLADAICDRIVYDSYVIRIDGDTMRKRKGILTELPNRDRARVPRPGPHASFARSGYTTGRGQHYCLTCGEGVGFTRS